MAYTEKQKEDLTVKICESITGGESLRNTLKIKGMPNRTTFYRWLRDEDIQNQYARATKARADYLFEQIIEIADKQEKDIIIIDSEEVINYNVIQRNRLQIDARKWVASKMNPKKYGDKLDVTTDNKPITPQETTVTFINARKKTE